MQSTMIAAPAGPEPSERISSYCTPSRPPAPRAIARWILSFGMLASAALSIAKRRRGLLFASPPPRRAATVISLIRRVQTRPRAAISAMAEHDIGSLVVLKYGKLTGMLTFREIIAALRAHAGNIGALTGRGVMNGYPPTCTPDADVDEVRWIMLKRHARYLPVLEARTLMGVISFYDVAKAVVEANDFENRMLKAYIRDWPEDKH